MKLKLSLQIIILFLSTTLYSQELSSKEQVVEMLMLSPNDTLLLECYIGKSWNSMNIYEKEQCKELSKRYTKTLKENLIQKKELNQQYQTKSFSSEVDSIESQSQKLLTDNLIKNEKQLEQNAKTAAEASIAELKELSQNTKKNLPLIVDLIEKKTSELNIEYLKIDTENGEEILSMIKMYGQKIYTETYKHIIESHGPKGE